jgi:hypothetical protein
MTKIHNAFSSEEWKEEFFHKFWYINNDTMHEVHAAGCKCRSGYRKSIMDFFAAELEKKEKEVNEIIKSIVPEHLKYCIERAEDIIWDVEHYGITHEFRPSEPQEKKPKLIVYPSPEMPNPMSNCDYCAGRKPIKQTCEEHEQFLESPSQIPPQEKVSDCCGICTSYARSNKRLASYDIPFCNNVKCNCHMKNCAEKPKDLPATENMEWEKDGVEAAIFSPGTKVFDVKQVKKLLAAREEKLKSKIPGMVEKIVHKINQ